jgi:hypothetical protein
MIEGAGRWGYDPIWYKVNEVLSDEPKKEEDIITIIKTDDLEIVFV